MEQEDKEKEQIMANYVYKIEVTDKPVDATHEHYFTSLKKVMNSCFAPLFKIKKKGIVTNRIKECRGVTGIIFEVNTAFSYVKLNKIKPL